MTPRKCLYGPHLTLSPNKRGLKSWLTIPASFAKKYQSPYTTFVQAMKQLGWLFQFTCLWERKRLFIPLHGSVVSFGPPGGFHFCTIKVKSFVQVLSAFGHRTSSETFHVLNTWEKGSCVWVLGNAKTDKTHYQGWFWEGALASAIRGFPLTQLYCLYI